MSTVPVRVPQLGLPAIGNVKSSRSQVGIQNQKERSVSMSLDMSGIASAGQEVKKKEVEVVVDDVGQTQKVSFRMSSSNFMKESQTVPVNVAAGGQKDHSVLNSIANMSTIIGSGEMMQSSYRGGSSTARSIHSSRMKAPTKTGSQKLIESTKEGVPESGTERELPLKVAEEKKFQISSKVWKKKEYNQVVKKPTVDSKSKSMQMSAFIPGATTSADEFRELLGKQPQMLLSKGASLPVELKEENEAPVKGSNKIRGAQGLNIKVMEMWINDMLFQAKQSGKVVHPASSNASAAMSNQQADEILEERDMLLQLGIDRQSLYRREITKEKVDRLYRSLFVYSFGFFEMMEDIFGHSPKSSKIVANVWKVFGQLLENCCRSDFQNTVQQIEQENSIVLSQLQEQIQNQNDRYEQLSEEQSSKISALRQQIAQITNEQENLMNQKLQLEEDYKQTDLAFNEEVSLRLQFEQKINELHSVHRELMMKHNRLLDDYDQLKEEGTIKKLELEKYVAQVEVLKVSECTALNEIKSLQWKVSEQTAMYEKLNQRTMQAESELMLRSRGNDKYESLMNEQKRINEDLEFRMKNLNERLELAKKNEELNLNRIDELKGEQKFYTSKFGDQSEKFSAQMTEIYDLKRTIVDQKETIQKQADQIDAINKQSNTFEDEIIQLKGDKKKVEQQYEYCSNRNELLTTDLEALQTMIRDMKFGRSELEEEYIKSKLRLTNAQDTLKAKNALCKDLEVKMEIYEQRLLKVTVEYQTYSNMTTKEIDVLKAKVSKLEREVKTKAHQSELEQKKIEYLNSKVDQFGEQVDGLHNEILELTTQKREDKFLISNQVNNINQLQSVVTTEQARSADLLAQIASTIATNEKLNRDNRSQNLIIRELQQNHSDTLKSLAQKHKRDMDQYSSVEFCIHQMEFEDLRSQFHACDEQKRQLIEENLALSSRFDKALISLEKARDRYANTAAELNKANLAIVAWKANVVHLVKKVLAQDKNSLFKTKQFKELQTEQEIQKKLFDDMLKEQKKKQEQAEAALKEQILGLMEQKKVIDKLYDESQEELNQLKTNLTEFKNQAETLSAALTAANSRNQQLQQQFKQLEEKQQQPNYSHSTVHHAETHRDTNTLQHSGQKEQVPSSNAPQSRQRNSPDGSARKEEDPHSQKGKIKENGVNRGRNPSSVDGYESPDDSNLQHQQQQNGSGAGERISKREMFELQVHQQQQQTQYLQQQPQLPQTARSNYPPANAISALSYSPHENHRNDQAGGGGFFVPYHLSDLGKMNYQNNVLHQTFGNDMQNRGRSVGVNSFSTNRGAYRLNAEHSAQVRRQENYKQGEVQEIVV